MDNKANLLQIWSLLFTRHVHILCSDANKTQQMPACLQISNCCISTLHSLARMINLLKVSSSSVPYFEYISTHEKLHLSNIQRLKFLDTWPHVILLCIVFYVLCVLIFGHVVSIRKFQACEIYPIYGIN